MGEYMTFEKYIFKMEDSDMYFKYQMNGLNDPTLQEFQFLSYSPLLKEEYRHEKAEKEYIDSYMEAAKIIAQNGRIHNSAIKFVIMSYSLALPCIFLCRQALELSMKRAISRLGQKYNAIHSLPELWNKFDNSFCKETLSSKGKETLLQMREFIDIINNTFDNRNATKLRYSEGKDGDLSQNKLIFVDLKKITETTELFIKQMELLTGNNSI